MNETMNKTLNINIINHSINELKTICEKSNIIFNDFDDNDSENDSVSTLLYDYNGNGINDGNRESHRKQEKRKAMSEQWILECKRRKYKQNARVFNQQSIDTEINLLDLNHLCLSELQSNQLYSNYVQINCLYSFKSLLELTKHNQLVLNINQFEKNVLKSCDNNNNNKHKATKARVEREKWELLSEQYWAESIADVKLHSDMSLVFWIKWCDYSEDENTWQRLCDIISCDLILNDYHNKQLEDSELVSYSIEDFKKFNRYLKECCGNDGDIAVILKLNKKTLDDWNRNEKMLQSCKSKLEIYLHAFNQIRVYKPEYLIPAKILIHLLVKELEIDQTFGSLKAFFEFYESRKLVKIALKEWETEVNRSLINTNEPLIMAENNIDLEIPKPINYITSYKFHNKVNVLSTNIPQTLCKCDDNCTRNRSCECCLKIYRDNKRFKTSNVLYECNSLCSCDPKVCPNRRVQNGRQFELTVFRTQSKGWGVLTNSKIPFRSFIMEYIGEIISSLLTPDRDCTYFFNIDEEYCGKCLFVDGSTSGNITRYANHSCEPNMDMYMAVVDHKELIPRITFFANRNIKPYEELTYHYGRKTLNLNENGDYVCSDDTCSQDSGRGTSNCDDDSDDDSNDRQFKRKKNQKMIYNKKSYNVSDNDILCLCGSLKCQKVI